MSKLDAWYGCDSTFCKQRRKRSAIICVICGYLTPAKPNSPQMTQIAADKLLNCSANDGRHLRQGQGARPKAN